MSSDEQFNRIVALVADLTRRDLQGRGGQTLAELAQRFATTSRQIAADIRALTMLGDDPEADWLLSLSVSQEGDEITISSGGPYLRPLRFTADELMAMQLGLADADGPAAMSADLAEILKSAEPMTHALAGHGRVAPSPGNLFRTAITNRCKVEIRYTGTRSLEGVNRVIHPYQLLEDQGRTYVVAWCELADGWRHFRLDRMLDAIPLDEHYMSRRDFVAADDSFAEPPEGVTPVQVRFSPAIARWLRERYPAAVSAPDGSVVVTYQVASPEWLVSHVLQYGPEAEVIAPASFRKLMGEQVVGG